MNRRLLGIGLAVVAFGGGAAVFMTGATANASGTAHTLVAASVKNYSAAVESPTWTFTCDTQTGAWTFHIDNVQVMDSHAHPWIGDNGTRGPWHVGMFTNTGVIFNASATLQQNRINGLFNGQASGTSSDITSWCRSGAGLSAFAFSRRTHDEQSLLIDATLS